MPFAAVDQDEVRPVFVALLIGIVRHQPAKAPRHHFAHHGEVITRRSVGVFDVKLAILALNEAFRSSDDHRAKRVGPLNMAIVVDFDPPRGFGKLEQVSNLLQQFALRRAFGQLAVERFFGVARGLFYKAHAVAALRHANLNLALGAFGQRLRQQIRLRQLPVQKNAFCGRDIFIKLRKEAGEHFILAYFGNMGGEEGPMPPILPTTDKKRLNTHHTIAVRQREYVCIADTLSVNRLRPLNEGQRL